MNKNKNKAMLINTGKEEKVEMVGMKIRDRCIW